jgi:hypothetical protein
LFFILQGLEWGDVARKTIKMPYLPSLDWENEINSVRDHLSLKLSTQLPGSTSQKYDKKFEVRKSTLSDVLVCGA